MNSLSGNQKIVQKWKIDNYKIECVQDIGFSGGNLKKYQLKIYASIPILIKHLETVNLKEKQEECIVFFPFSKINFDKCEEVIRFK